MRCTGSPTIWADQVVRSVTAPDVKLYWICHQALPAGGEDDEGKVKKNVTASPLTGGLSRGG